MMYNVLVTGAGAPGGPGIIKSLLKLDYINLFTADASDDAAGKYLLKEKFSRIPKADDSNFCQEVLDLCVEKKIKVVFPLVTKELLQFSENAEAFQKNGVGIIISQHDSLSIAINKCRLYEHLSLQNIALPKFKVVKSYQQFLEAIDFIGYPQQSFCIKPGLSNGGRGIRIVDDSINRFDQLFNYKPNSLYTSFNDLNGILQQNNFPELLVSEVLPGNEITIDTIIENGKPQLILPRKRLKMISGITVQGEFFHDETVIDYANQVLNSLKLNGPIGIQLRQNSDDEYRILEINPRIQGTSVAAMGLNINLPELAVRNALKLENRYPTSSEIKWGTKFSRFYTELFY